MTLGLSYDVPGHEYHAWEGLGSTSIRVAAQWSVAHALEAAKATPTPAMTRGTLLHAAVLEPGRLGVDILAAPEAVPCEGSGKKSCSRMAVPGARHCWQHGGREEAEEWQATLPPGAMVVSREEYDEAGRAAEAIRSQVARSSLGRMLDGGAREVSMSAAVVDLEGTYELSCDVDAPRDLIVRGRVDLLHEGVAVDLKTVTQTSALGSRRMSYRLDDYGMTIQARLYLDILRAATDREHAWLWLVAEQSPPYGVRIYEPDGSDLEAAVDEIHVALLRWQKYLESGDPWSGWPRGTEIVARPHRWEED